MDNSYRFYPFGVRNPHIIELKSREDNTIIFDGYFYVDVADLPVQRVMVRYGEKTVDDDGNSYRSVLEASHIEIYEKISGEDTSCYGGSEDISGNVGDGDDSEENICFFPTEITTLKFRVLKSDLSSMERDMVIGFIVENEKMREKAKIDALLAVMDRTDD